MSIEIKYMASSGNIVFQYVYARLLAVKNKLYLKTKFPVRNLLKTTRHEPGRIIKSPTIMICDRDGLGGGEFFYKELPPAHYALKGWFQDPDFYNPNKELIRSFFILDKVKKNTEDIIMAVRLGDYCNLGQLIHPKWYLNILKKESFRRLYIVGCRTDEPYLEHFRKYKPIVIEPRGFKDFHTIRKFDKIICSNSSFIWWAAFLSDASRVYTFARWINTKNKSAPILFKQSFLKNAIRVDGEFVKGYTPKTYYPRLAVTTPGGHVRLIKDWLKGLYKKPR